MNKILKPPALSTSFSENGKRAKKRFDNILNIKAKKTGALAFVSMLIFVGVVGMLVGFNSGKNITYFCNTFDCCFELPRSWENKYEIEERNANIVYVYHKAIRKEYGEGTGLLFYIEMLKGDKLTHEDITDPGNRSIALQGDGYTYVFGMPTDVQYPIWDGGNKELADDYLKMSEDNEKIKKSIRRVTANITGTGTAIVTEDTDLLADPQGNGVGVELMKNDLVYVIYDENDDFYYVQLPVMSIPPTEGYISKKAVSFDKNLFDNANFGIVKNGKIYKSTNEKDIYQEGHKNVFRIIKRQGEWAEVNLVGGDDGKWVKISDISYELIPYNIDLSYTDMQKEVDNGRQLWRLNPLEVAQDYVYNTLKKSGGTFEITHSDDDKSMVTYTSDENEDSVIHFHRPIKKDHGGIWVVDDNTIMMDKIRGVIPKGKQIAVNSGMGWNIRVTDKTDYKNNDYGDDFNLEQEAKKLGINIYDYIGHDLKVLIYGIETAEDSSREYTYSPYIFVFEGTNMIAYKDLKSMENEMIARDIMITLYEHNNAGY
ncbi:MAG TPA: hypothetical protein PLA01_01280 [Acetivibrio sp.]|nr:hypothetical protein [Acetivibrio sp.]